MMTDTMDKQTQNPKELINKMIKESPRKKCVCGCEYFDTATVQIQVSALLSGTGKNETLLAAVLLCRKCGEENAPSKIVT